MARLFRDGRKVNMGGLVLPSVWDCVHIRCCGNGCLGFRPDGGLTFENPAWLMGRGDQRPPRGGLIADLILGGTAFPPVGAGLNS